MSQLISATEPSHNPEPNILPMVENEESLQVSQLVIPENVDVLVGKSRNEEAYSQQLQTDIALKKQFLERTQKILDESKSAAIEPQLTLQELKSQTMALYETLGKLPYVKERSDTINISLAIDSLTAQKEALTRSLQDLDSYSNHLSKEIDSNRAIVNDFQDLNQLMETRINELEKVAFSTKAEKLSLLDQKIKDATTREVRLMKNLKTLLTKYLNKVLYPDFTLSKEVDSQEISRNFKVIELLLNSMTNDKLLQDGWLLVDDTSNPILKLLLKNDIILQKDDLSKIKLRLYGFTYEEMNK